MSGQFFDRPLPPHVCDTPGVDHPNAVYGWRCDCGKAYVVDMITQHGETWKQWKRKPTLDAGPAGEQAP